MGFCTSPETKELFAALVDAQAEMPVAKKSSKSRFHRYATYNDLVLASRPTLSKFGLAVFHGPTYTEDKVKITTRIVHKPSGQWIESELPVMPIALVKEDIQSFCGHITYLVRYSYKLMVGIIADDEEDDDGETAMTAYRPTNGHQNGNYPVKEECITKEQLDQLEYEMIEHPDIKKKVLVGLSIQSLASMPKSKYFSSLERIRTIKKDMGK